MVKSLYFGLPQKGSSAARNHAESFSGPYGFSAAGRGAGVAPLYRRQPMHEAHGVAGAGERAVAGDVVDHRHVIAEIGHGAGDRDPILQLGGAGLEYLLAEIGDLADVALAQGVEE